MTNNFDEYANEYAKKLKRKIRITKGSRFLASKTLSRQSELSITSISFLSVYTIAISIIQNIVDSTLKCPNLNRLYTITSIILSVFILVLSLLEGSKNYQIRAERLYNNAKELSKLSKEIDYICYQNSKSNELDKELKKIGDQYDELIDKCPENHNPDDYWLFKTEDIKEFQEDFKGFLRIRVVWIPLYYYWTHYWLYIVSILVPIPSFIWLYSMFKCG